MAEDLPAEALARVFHCLPIKQRSRLACVSRAWRAASGVDAVSVKLKDTHVPSYLHLALPDGAAQELAAACPLMALARSADLHWESAATGALLQSCPSLERLKVQAFRSMASVPAPLDASGCPGGHDAGLQSLRSLTNLQSLQLNISDAAAALEAVPSAPASLREIELHLTGDNWQTSVLDKIANQLGAQATRLASLSLRCSHAAVYAATEPLESLSRLSGLTSLRMGPNPEDVFPHSSPLGFRRLPAFLAAMGALQHLDITVADCAASAPLAGISFDPIRHIPDVKLTLRADTSIRAVSSLPASISRLSGLTALTVQAFTFEDPGGWCTHALFDVRPLAGCRKLRALELQLGTWEAEHCEAFELPGLKELSQLSSLRITVASRFIQLGGPARPHEAPQVQEVLLSLPAMRPAAALHIASSMRVVLRNSKALARAVSPGVLAHSIQLEEPLPPRNGNGGSSSGSSGSGSGGSTAAAPPARPDALRATGRGGDQAAQAAVQQVQYVRAPAHVVIGALPELWPGMEVWQYPTKVPGVSSWQHVQPELLCKADARDELQAALCQALVAGAALGGSDDLAAPDQGVVLW